MRRGRLSVFLGVGALLVACSSGDFKPDRACTPKANVHCYCGEDKEEAGTKKCNPDGRTYQACLPCDGSGLGEDADERDPLGVNTRRTTPERAEEDATKKPASAEAEEEEQPVAEEEEEPSTPEKPTTEAPQKEPPTTEKPSTEKPPTTVKPTPPETPATKPGTSTSTGTDKPDAPHCKALKNVAKKVELQKVADEATAAVGGKPVPGLYIQSWVVQFTGAGGEAGPAKEYSRQTIEIADDVGRYSSEDKDGKALTGGFRMEFDGNKVEIAYECPASAPKQMSYDADESTLILYDPPYARVFVRQEESK